MHDGSCELCRHEVPLERNSCPHCGRPGLFPNVRAASAPDERAALDRRYRAALQDAAVRGCGSRVADFERAVAGSKAVMARPLREVDRLAASDQELVSTFYKMLAADVRLPHGNQWDYWRRVADEALFPGYKGRSGLRRSVSVAPVSPPTASARSSSART